MNVVDPYIASPTYDNLPASVALHSQRDITPRLLSVAEAAASLGISESLFRREVLTHVAIEAVSIGGRRLIVPDSLDTYVAWKRDHI